MHRRVSLKLKKSSSSSNSFTNTEKLIKECTHNDSWGPTGTELNQLAILSHNSNDLKIITKCLTKRLKNSNKYKDYRSILKSLTIIHFVLQVGSLEFVEWCKSIKSLLLVMKDYQLVISKNPEVHKQITNINHKSISILELLEDDKLLEQKRVEFHILRSQMSIPGFHDTNRHPKNHSSDNLNQQDKIDVVDNSLNFQIPQRSVKSLEINRSQLFGSLNAIDSSSSDEEDNGSSGNVSRPLSPLNRINNTNNGSTIPRNSSKLSKSDSSNGLTTLLEEEETEGDINSNRISTKLMRSFTNNNNSPQKIVVENKNFNNDDDSTHYSNTSILRSLSLNSKKSPLSLSINTNLDSNNNNRQYPSTVSSSPLSTKSISINSTPKKHLNFTTTPYSPSALLPDSNPFKQLVEQEEKFAEAQAQRSNNGLL